MKNVFLKENTIENDKEPLGRSITSLGYSTEKECRNLDSYHLVMMRNQKL